jgi:cellulose synthase/poly-beta-1,6-N-acetylglucosamine synthase-like glycosyltransferase
MTILEVDLSLLFVIAVILIWFTIAYQFILTVFGYINYVRSIKEKRELDKCSFEYPSCSILIPAHNEEKVIAATIESLLKLEYPKDKLQIIVINDGSKDATKSIIEQYAVKDARVQLFDIPKGEGGKGKSRTLNLGIKQAKGDVIAIYDADNTPDKDSLRYLVAQLLLHKELGAVIGKFRTVNKNASLLTRFINIETLSFQSMLQAGRWQMHGISTLPGTNFVMWHHIIKKLGGWDEKALTEDSELSIRIYEEGYKIKFIPYAITYEQEPQQWGTWIKQRMRWVHGNNYVVKKFWKEIPRFKSKRMAFDLLYTLSLYYIFFVAVVFSDVLFLVSLFQLVTISLPGPYTFVWVTSLILFLFELFLSISYDGEDTLTNFAIIILMYFTYSQLWIYVVIKSVYQDLFKKENHTWDKTVRFDIPAAHS